VSFLLPSGSILSPAIGRCRLFIGQCPFICHWAASFHLPSGGVLPGTGLSSPASGLFFIFCQRAVSYLLPVGNRQPTASSSHYIHTTSTSFLQLRLHTLPCHESVGPHRYSNHPSFDHPVGSVTCLILPLDSYHSSPGSLNKPFFLTVPPEHFRCHNAAISRRTLAPCSLRGII
jgi:hypothetical protein